MADLLDAAGFRVRRSRADCPHCKGHSRLTVAFTDEVAYCHRCAWRANIHQLARQQGRVIPQRRIGRARIRRKQFTQWLDATYTQKSLRECQLARRAELAGRVLANFPDSDPAWSALARWYHQQRRLAAFFAAASDQIGRVQLYRAWRRHVA